MKNEKHKKSLNVTTTIKFFTFFLYIENNIFCSKKYFLKNVIYTIAFLKKLVLVLQDIWDEVMKHQRSYRSSLVL